MQRRYRNLTDNEIDNTRKVLKDLISGNPRLSAKKRTALTEAVENALKGKPVFTTAQHRKKKPGQKPRITKSSTKISGSGILR